MQRQKIDGKKKKTILFADSVWTRHIFHLQVIVEYKNKTYIERKSLNYLIFYGKRNNIYNMVDISKSQSNKDKK